ncbi:TIGR04076 family protein [candidate division KSB1 bacterium]
MTENSGKLNRRKFCTNLPCGALLALSIPYTALFSCNSPSNELNIGEIDMQNQITSVEAKVVSQNGTCGMGHKVGDIVKFTENGVEGKICIHALYSIMPKIFAFMYDAKFPWLQDPDVSTHACPDAFNPVVYEVKRIRQAE